MKTSTETPLLPQNPQNSSSNPHKKINGFNSVKKNEHKTYTLPVSPLLFCRQRVMGAMVGRSCLEQIVDRV